MRRNGQNARFDNAVLQATRCFGDSNERYQGLVRPVVPMLSPIQIAVHRERSVAVRRNPQRGAAGMPECFIWLRRAPAAAILLQRIALMNKHQRVLVVEDDSEGADTLAVLVKPVRSDDFICTVNLVTHSVGAAHAVKG